MCHYILLAIDHQTETQEILTIMENNGYKLDPSDSEIEDKSLSKKYNLYYTTSGVCDCGTAIGSYIERGIYRPDDRTIGEKKKKGWSDARIRRWVKEIEKGQKKNDVRAESFNASPSDEIERWQKMIREIVSLKDVHSIGLMKVWSPKSRIKLSERIEVKIDEADQEYFKRIEEDTLYLFQ